MTVLPEGILEKITEFLTLDGTKKFSVADKEIYKELLPKIFLQLYKQHQKTYLDQPQDSDEEPMIFQFDEEASKKLAEQESFEKLVEIFSTIKDCDFPAIQDLKSQDLMKKIQAEIDARENPYSFLYCRSLSVSSLESPVSQGR